MTVLYKCLLAWIGYSWLLSHTREGGGKNPGVGIRVHTQWSSRSSVCLQDSLFTIWPLEGFLSGLLLPSIHSALSGSHMSPHAPSFPFHEHILPRFDLSACVPSSSFLSNVCLTPIPLSSPKSYLLFQEGFPDYPSHPYSCRTVYAPLSQHLGYWW